MGTSHHSAHETVVRRACISICAVAISFISITAFGQTSAAKRTLTALASRADSARATQIGDRPVFIVIGFVGGFIRHDNLAHSEVQLAASLRALYPSGVTIQTFENYHGEKARKTILSLLDANQDGELTPGEKQSGRIIIYGHSWGGSEAVSLARELQKDNVSVMLTLQVDSVAKFHQDDAVIPENVRQAANFFQSSGRMHGQSTIRAADPARTKIIGNFRFDYSASPYNCKGYPWYDRVFGKTHTQIECDPTVWEQVESLIRSNLPSANPHEPTP